METFTKDDLVYEYNWSKYEKDDPKISGMPDTSKFNRKEGWQTLYIINHLTNHLAWDVDSFGKKIEKLIHDRLPKEINNQKDTIKWIKDNWKNWELGYVAITKIIIFHLYPCCRCLLFVLTSSQSLALSQCGKPASFWQVEVLWGKVNRW